MSGHENVGGGICGDDGDAVPTRAVRANAGRKTAAADGGLDIKVDAAGEGAPGGAVAVGASLNILTNEYVDIYH